MDALPLNHVRSDLPAELAAIVAKMMAKAPGHRFQTPSEVAMALAPFFKKRSLGHGGPALGLSPATVPKPASALAAETETTRAAAGREGGTWSGLIKLDEMDEDWDSASEDTGPLLGGRRLSWLAVVGVAGLVLCLVGIAAVVSLGPGRGWFSAYRPRNATPAPVDTTAKLKPGVEKRRLTVRPRRGIGLHQRRTDCECRTAREPPREVRPQKSGA